MHNKSRGISKLRTDPSHVLAILLAGIIGFIWWYLLVSFWAVITHDNNPFFQWLIDQIVDGKLPEQWAHPIIHAQDILINTVVSFPVVVLIFSLKPKGSLQLFIVFISAFTLRGWWGTSLDYFESTNFLNAALRLMLELFPPVLVFVMLRVKFGRPTPTSAE